MVRTHYEQMLLQQKFRKENHHMLREHLHQNAT